MFKKFTLYDETESVASDSTKLIDMKEKQQTPLQKLKTKLQTLLRAEGLRDAHLGIETSLKYLNDLLPEEKQMVIDAYNDGSWDGRNNKPTSGEQYFNETFES